MKRLYNIALFLRALLVVHSSCMVELAICSSNFTDQSALLAFKSSINHDPNNALSNWTKETNFCSWFGVSCGVRHRQRVTSLILSDMGLRGTISSHVGNLSFLQLLDLGNNNFQGLLIEEIGRLHRLKVLILHLNNFSGVIPKELSTLPFLKTLKLGKNNLTGTIPPCFGNTSSLEWFELEDNNIFGSIPTELGQLPNLRILPLSSNHLTDVLLKKPYKLNEMESKWTTKSNFTSQVTVFGSIPLGLSNLSSLSILILDDNQLTGELHEFPNTSLDFIDLRNNELSGPIPPLRAINILISYNKFIGEIPSAICNVSSLEILDLAHNNLIGVIPQCLGNFTVLRVLDLGMNNLHGNIPFTFSKGNALRNIDLNSNKLEGLVPQTFAYCRHLEVLDLGNNQLNDTFPNWMETLPELKVLILQYNKFHGSIETLKTKIPFPKLRIIDISHNEFRGLLPTKYFKNFKAMLNVEEKAERQYMENDNYYYNNSVTIVMKGIKVKLERILITFTTIDLSDNKFKGKIPNVIGKLNSLRLLNLSHNSLTGSIPSSLENLCKLESLDLSSNHLSGKIPTQMTSLTFLEVLNLSKNHLEGRIPQGNQFDTFENSSYDGNLELCGFPLTKECSDNETPQLHPQPMLHEEDDPTFTCGFNWKVALMGYGCGTVFGLVMGYLMFVTGKPKWFVGIVEGG